VSRVEIPPALVEGFLKLCEGDFSHRLKRNLQRDGDDAVAFFFNTIAEELERILRMSRDQELRLKEAVGHLTEALAKVRSAERDFRTLFEAAPIPMILVDAEGRVRACNGRVAMALLGPQAGEVGARLADVFYEPAQCEELFVRLRAAGAVDGLAARVRMRDGSVAWWLVSASTLALDDGNAIVCSFVDLSEQKRTEERLRRLASRDSLTDALTRSAFIELAGEEVGVAARSGRSLCLAMLDLDHFKSVNDQHGHHVGDHVLRSVVQKVTAGARAQDRVGRYGGDEFAMVMPDTAVDTACEALERLRAAVASIRLEYPVAPTISVGVAALRTGESLEGVLRRADEALYRAKALGRNVVVAA
jgi:diguanylate cyclase (GGDEF)-like protein/PAS domain S-box-containing protein